MNQKSCSQALLWIVLCAGAFWLGDRLSGWLSYFINTMTLDLVRQAPMPGIFLATFLIGLLFSVTTFLLIWLLGRKRFGLPFAWSLGFALIFPLTLSLLNMCLYGFDMTFSQQLSQAGIMDWPILTNWGGVYQPMEPSGIGFILASLIPGSLVGAATGAVQGLALRKRGAGLLGWIGAVALAIALSALADSVLLNNLTLAYNAGESMFQVYALSLIHLFLPLGCGLIYGLLTAPLLKRPAPQPVVAEPEVAPVAE